MPQANNNATVDVVQNTGSGLQGSGLVAQALMQNNFSVESLRVEGVLRKDEWVNFDEAVVEVATKRLVAVADLMNAGLTYGVQNALGVTKVEWERVSEMTDAEISMGGITQGQNDRVTYDLQSVPLPIIHKDFHINIRALEASRTTGQSLDTTQAEIAARIVSEKIESLLFDGSDIAGSTNKIYGYKTAPNRTTGSTTADFASATGAQIVGDVLDMINDAQNDNMYGPYVLYVTNAGYINMGDDYKAESDKTILQRVLEIPGIQAVRPSKDLAAGEAILVQMTRDVVDMVNGIEPTTVQWDSHGGFMVNFKVLAIMVPRIKSDKNSQSGIVHYT